MSEESLRQLKESAEKIINTWPEWKKNLVGKYSKIECKPDDILVFKYPDSHPRAEELGESLQQISKYLGVRCIMVPDTMDVSKINIKDLQEGIC
jgi:hypothetical protein